MPPSPLLWAQVQDTTALALLALRRWWGSLTLASPEPAPRLGPILEAWLLGLLALVAMAVVAQGPARALRQLVDLPGQVRVIAAALVRLRKAGRLVAVVFGVSVLAWTTDQALRYRHPQGLDDLMLLLKTRSVGEAALEQGLLAGLTPLRDLCGLGDTLLLVIAAAVIIFRVSADRWSGLDTPHGPGSASLRPSSAAWATVAWMAAGLYALYRFTGRLVDTGDLPAGGCLVVEAAVVPLLMLLADGVLLAWALVELRNAGLGDAGGEPLDVPGTIGLLPAASLACLAALPARYLAAAAWLTVMNWPDSSTSATSQEVFRWLLGWGLIVAQAAAVVTVGLVGAVAWSRGTFRGAIRGYGRVLAAEGGRLAASLALAGLAAVGLAAAAYWVVLSLPVQPWVLAAADSYAHYATLAVGLVLLAVLVELGARALPLATLAEPAAPEAHPMPPPLPS